MATSISPQDKNWLRNHPLFASFSDQEFEATVPFITSIHVLAKAHIINMNQTTFDLYLLQKGRAKTYDSSHDHAQLFVAQFAAGDIIGEAAFLTHEKRLCDVIASSNSDLFVISESLKQKNPIIYHELRENLQKVMMDRMRQSNAEQLRLQKIQVELLQEQIHFSRFFIATILIFSIVILINFALGHFLKDVNVYNPEFARIYLLLVAIPLFVLAKINKQPLSMFGLTLYNWKNACIRGVIIAFVMILLISLIKMVSNWHHHLPLFHSVLYAFKRAPPFSYFFSVILQQSIRAFLQNSLNKIFIGHVFYAIFFSSFIFGLFHIHIGLIAVLLTFLIGILFAIMYEKDKNIIGLTIAHTLTGAMAYATGLI